MVWGSIDSWQPTINSALTIIFICVTAYLRQRTKQHSTEIANTKKAAHVAQDVAKEALTKSERVERVLDENGELKHLQ